MEIKSGLTLENLLSSHLISKNVKVQTHKTVILFAILCWSETWSATLTNKYTLRVFETRVPRIFEPKRQEVRGQRKMHDDLHNLYEIKEDGMGWTCTTMHGADEKCIHFSQKT
jgi:hypothetical protein